MKEARVFFTGYPSLRWVIACIAVFAVKKCDDSRQVEVDGQDVADAYRVAFVFAWFESPLLHCVYRVFSEAQR